MKSVICLFVLTAAMCTWADENQLRVGDSDIHRQGVNYALHVPPAAETTHAALGLLVFFGGVGDSTAYYQKAFTPMADDLGLVVVVPQMPWFSKPGDVGVPGVLASLDGLRREIEARFRTDPGLVIVSGASAGGNSACLLASRWDTAVPLLVLHSTGPCRSDVKARILHLVGQQEAAFLPEDGRSGTFLGQGTTDMFAVPGEAHEVHFKDMRWWVETELSALRLAASGPQVALAEKDLAAGKPAEAKARMQVYADAARVLAASVVEGDAFTKYQNVRRRELLNQCRKAIGAVEQMQRRIENAPQPPLT